MGVNNRVFDLIATHCRRSLDDPGDMLVAGYPDMLIDRRTLQKYFGHTTFPADPASAQITKGHARAGISVAPDPFPVFAALGYPDLTVIDIHQERGCEVVVDLNRRWAPGHKPFLADIARKREEYMAGPHAYDLVLDHGTIEHCFNIAQAAINLADAVCEGGYIVQHLPANLFNHGFYNLNPTWFWDFYETNGFKIEHFEAWSLDGLNSFQVERYKDFVTLPPYTLYTMVAKRVEVTPIAFPIQRKYR